MSIPAAGDIAIIGMACVFPGAGSLRQYWENILNKVDAVSDPPPEWESEFYHDSDSGANDRTYCVRGGFLGELATFDPASLGVMPASVDGTEPDHFLALRAAQESLSDAGYADIGRFKERTAVIIGRGTYVNRGNTNAMQHVVMVDAVLRALKQLHPEHTEEDLATIRKELKASLPPFDADTAAGLVPNIISGRIANRLDLMGPNYIVDAACASSLVAIDLGSRDLLSGRCDMAVVGGVNASVPPVIMAIFSQLNALSKTDQIRPFDSAADGTLLGEGVGMIVLKRLADAESDGDRVYAVLKGVGVASDGRAIGLLAPRLEGEELALKRAYEAAGVDPSTVGLIEAHGTATLVGDAVEVEALRNIAGRREGEVPRCALGSVKSMISHTMPAAGVAGLIKVVCALHHKVLPPTLHCENPNVKLGLEDSNFYLNSETRPWIHGSDDVPRRAGVNAFGFGGINAHAIVEEYAGPNQAQPIQHNWDSELFVVSSDSDEQLVTELTAVRQFVADLSAEVTLKDLAWTLNCDREFGSSRVAIVASSRDELITKLERAGKRIADPKTTRIRAKDGLFFAREQLTRRGGKLALVFPGEGAQYVNMLSDLCVYFPEVREWFDRMDRIFRHHARGYLLSDAVYPPPMNKGADRLWSMDIGAEAVFTANQGIFALLKNLGVRADAMVGHSTGEHSSLIASEAVRTESENELVSHIIGVNNAFERLSQANEIRDGALLAVSGPDREMLSRLLERNRDNLFVALDNCPHQLVLFGTEECAQQVMNGAAGKTAICQKLPFGRPYHTPWFQSFTAELRRHFDGITVTTPNTKLYSCVTAQEFPDDPDQIRRLASDHWAATVRFRETVEQMYADGFRIFVEAGPRGNLAAFIDDTLRDKEHVAVPANLQHRSGIRQLNYLLGELVAHGAPVRLERLYEDRAPKKVSDVMPKPRRQTVIATGLQPLRLPPDLKLPERRTERSHQETADPVRSGAETVRSAVMDRHFHTMQTFLATQQQVMSTYLGRQKTATQTARGSFPFVTEEQEIVPGKTARVLYRYRPERDLLFRDHTLGRGVSEADGTLTGLGVIPLTITMEMLAQGGAVLMPGKLLIGMRDIRASRWITLENTDLTLRIDAEISGEPGTVRVRIRENKGTAMSPVLAEGSMVFANEYPAAPRPADSRLREVRKSEWPSDRLYEDGMFHGPLFRAVTSMDSRAANGCSATLKVPERDGLIASDPSPNFLTDAVILDAAGQVVALWSQEELQPKGDIFPYRLVALHCYGPPQPPGTQFDCRVHAHHIDEGVIHSDIEILDGAGNLYYKLENWEDRRFRLPRRLWDMRTSPRDSYMAERWDAPVKIMPEGSGAVACRISSPGKEVFEASHGIWLKVLVHLVLSPREREEWYSSAAVDKRRHEWLLGRCAAKDAVRYLVRDKFGVDICAADVEITRNAGGRPEVSGRRLDELGVRPVVSIAHSEGTAAALASLSTADLIGIDIEPSDRSIEGVGELALTEEEQRLISLLENRREWLLRVWTAKEAAGKALGTGLSRGVHSLGIARLTQESGLVELELRDGLLNEYPDFAGRRLAARTIRDRGFICSTVLQER